MHIQGQAIQFNRLRRTMNTSDQMINHFPNRVCLRIRGASTLCMGWALLSLTVPTSARAAVEYYSLGTSINGGGTSNGPGQTSVTSTWSSAEGSEPGRLISLSAFASAGLSGNSMNFDCECEFSYNADSSLHPDWHAGVRADLLAAVTFDHPVVYRGVSNSYASISVLRMSAYAYSGNGNIFEARAPGLSDAYETAGSAPFFGLNRLIDLHPFSQTGGAVNDFPTPLSHLGGAHAGSFGSVEWDENTVVGQNERYFDATGVARGQDYDQTIDTTPGGCDALVNFQPRTWAGRPANAAVAFSPTTGSFSVGRHTVTCTVNYAWGPVQTFPFTVTVNAAPGPCPKSMMVVANGLTASVLLKHPAFCGADHRNLLVLDEQGGVIISNANSPAEVQATFPIGSNYVAMSGTRDDGFGFYNCAFQVTVLPSYGLPEDHPDDSDGDEIPDWLELLAHTNPLDAEDRFEMRMTAAPAGMRLAWEGRAGVAYQVEEGGLDVQGWSPAGPVISVTSDGPQSLLVPTTGHSRRFFKLSLVNQP